MASPISDSAGPMAPRMSSTRSIASAGRSTSMARRSKRESRRWPIPVTRRKAVAHNEYWLPWLTKEIAALGIGVTPERPATFCCCVFPAPAAEHPKRRRLSDVAGLAAALGGAAPIGPADCLRLTIAASQWARPNEGGSLRPGNARNIHSKRRVGLKLLALRSTLRSSVGWRCIGPAA